MAVFFGIVIGIGWIFSQIYGNPSILYLAVFLSIIMNVISYWFSLVGGLLKECSNFVQKTPPICTFRKIVRGCLGALRLGMVFPRENPSIFEGERKRPLGNAEVQTNLFSFAFSERLSVFFFDCPKTNLKTIWTT